jgi:hypothetical protein
MPPGGPRNSRPLVTSTAELPKVGQPPSLRYLPVAYQQQRGQRESQMEMEIGGPARRVFPIKKMRRNRKPTDLSYSAGIDMHAVLCVVVITPYGF